MFSDIPIDVETEAIIGEWMYFSYKSADEYKVWMYGKVKLDGTQMQWFNL